MKNDIQNIRKEANSTSGRQAGTAGIGKRFGEREPRDMTGEEWACAE